ncbi:MAG: carboxypeptidase regulatory-like domain-containing protein, partial [Micromonosporaceae bacterium]|nr:carboxypeptidase regulatory-like domain-containing protein [Micromonosporaceae bacterium]
CLAGPGWDGPTGVGTPDGVAGLTLGPHGDIVGQVTDAASGQPIGGTTVSTAEGYSAVADPAGHYDMAVPVGSYAVTASQFGYVSGTATGVAVGDGESVTQNFALAKLPTHSVSGTVSDGSGHAWPLYAKITISGYPGNAIYTDPYTGHYSIDLPEGDSFTMHVAPVIPGYSTKDVPVTIGTADQTVDVAPTVTAQTCQTPGYAFHYDGSTEQFTGWTGTATQDGWSNVDNKGNGQVWNFDNPRNRPAPPGGDADFAILDSDFYGPGNSQDAALVSPVVDLSGQTAPEIGFDTYYLEFPGSTADVDLSLDAGQTWSNVWHQTTTVQRHVDISIPQAAGGASVRVRFRYTGTWADWWELDNVFVGTRTCAPQPGGLVAGMVQDGNTGAPLNGAKVGGDGQPGAFGLAGATPDDANLADGYYWLFSSATGAQAFTVTDGRYRPAHASVTVAANSVTRKDWALLAGHLAVAPEGLSVAETLGTATSRTFTLTDDGSAAVHVRLDESNAGFTPVGAARPAAQLPGAPAQMVELA